MATWDESRQRARVEVIFGAGDRELFEYIQGRAQRLGMSLPEFLRALPRALLLAETGDSSLLGLLGTVGAPTALPQRPTAAAEDARPADTSLMDSALEQFGF